jgi:D-alanyl-D-alanine carboxypeptidase
MVLSFSRRLAASALAIAALVSASLALSTTEADARKRRGGYAPPYASIVVDVKTGQVLQGTNADAPRFPASVTKVMTLYLLFEQIERGRFQLDTPLKVSSYAAGRPPSKIGFDPGETIEVEDAIKALVTKSANDVAVVVAEAISGDEESFGELMTRKARALGMSRTTFRNASGLPDSEQVTTARDLATLGRAMNDRFPKYWHYFQTRNFEFAGRNYRNHNRLLGRVEGVDGIKTGFTRASGFNLLTSARDGNRHLMAVVLGGRSGRIRDAQMASLVESHLPRAYAGRRTAPVIAEARVEEPAQRVAVLEAPQRQPEVRAETPARPAQPPVVVTQAPERRPVVVAAAPAQPKPAERLTVAQAPERVAAAPATQPVAAFAAAQPQPARPQMRWATGAQPVAATRNAPGRQAQLQTAQADPVTTASTTTRPVSTGFVVQLGASDSEAKARAILDSAKVKNRAVLADASAFTEKVQKGDATLYRARFGGFDDSKDANSACGALKKSGFNCFVQRI